jgi:hypothetical protein
MCSREAPASRAGYPACHSERSEGSAFGCLLEKQIPRFARDDRDDGVERSGEAEQKQKTAAHLCAAVGNSG